MSNKRLNVIKNHFFSKLDNEGIHHFAKETNNIRQLIDF
jgi:hypothetical protein